MTRKSRKITKRHIFKHLVICMTTIFLIIIFNIIVIKNNLITPKVDELTTSYVSLYNQDTTDMLKITNIEKLSDEKGKSKYNKKFISFTITSDNKDEYEVILYEIQNDIPEKYIKIEIEGNKENKISTLDKYEKKEDGGRKIYIGKTGNKKIKIKMWVSEKYKKKINDTSFEIRVKKR